MKKLFSPGVFIFLLFLFMSIPKLSAESKLPFTEPEITISLDFQDASLKDILKVLSIQSRLNFIASESVQDRKITVYLNQVPLNKVMDKLFKANNLSYELDTDSNIFVVKDWGKMQTETITRIFYLKYASVSSSSLKEELSKQIASGGASGTSASGGGSGGGTASGKWGVEKDTGITQAVKKLLSENGSVIEDYRTNSLIVTDVPSRMSRIAQVIAAIDISVPQVMLEVEMLDVSKNSVDKLGFKFGQTPMTFVLTGASRYTTFPFSSWAGGDYDTAGRTSPKAGNINSGSVSFNPVGSSYSIILDFLKTQSDTKYLARPRILTLNNETAEINITTQETVGVTTSATTTEGTAQTETGKPERVETGVKLRVTPQINNETGEITMFIMPSVKDTSTSSFLVQGSTSQFFKDPEERSTKSVVRIKDGETVIIGGLIRNDSAESITKLPFLGDIPVLGALFRHKDKTKDRERELLVFITPHIIKDKEVKYAEVKKISVPDREQNTVSVASRESSIKASLDNFEKGKR